MPSDRTQEFLRSLVGNRGNYSSSRPPSRLSTGMGRGGFPNRGPGPFKSGGLSFDQSLQNQYGFSPEQAGQFLNSGLPPGALDFARTGGYSVDRIGLNSGPEGNTARFHLKDASGNPVVSAAHPIDPAWAAWFQSPDQQYMAGQSIYDQMKASGGSGADAVYSTGYWNGIPLPPGALAGFDLNYENGMVAPETPIPEYGGQGGGLGQGDLDALSSQWDTKLQELMSNNQILMALLNRGDEEDESPSYYMGGYY